MDPQLDNQLRLNRRQFFGLASAGIGTAALATLMSEDLRAAGTPGALQGLPHFAPTAKRVIYLFQSGGPVPDGSLRLQAAAARSARLGTARIDPDGAAIDRHDLDAGDISGRARRTSSSRSTANLVRGSATCCRTRRRSSTTCASSSRCTPRRSTTIRASRSSRPAPSWPDGRASARGFPTAWAARTATCRRSWSWCPRAPDGPAISRSTTGLWGSGFLPSKYQGVKFRSTGDPVLYLSNPTGFSSDARRRYLDYLGTLNQMKQEESGDPEIATRIAQYEMAYRMQTSVPDLTDLSKESDRIFEMYGPESRTPGTFAANCLLARRLAERGVRFVQLFHRGWDHHNTLPKLITGQCQDTDQPGAALIQDLKERGLLEDTLVVWGGEFGRTVYCQGKLTADDYGRDHHPRCFTVWLAGGGIKPGITYGETDDYCYNITRDPVHVHDLHATILHCLGIDHTQLTFKYQGRHFRLTDVHGVVKKEILA